MDRINIDVTFGSARGAALTSISAEDWREGMLKALRPALIIFLIGIALLGLTAAMAWNPYLSVERDSTGGSRIVDDLGLFGQPGAIVELNRGQTDAYVAARTEMHRDNLLICLAVGVLGLGAGSILIAWSQLKDEKSLSGNHSRTKRVASSE